MEKISTPSQVSEPVSSPVSTPAPTQRNNRNWLIPLFSVLIVLLLASTGYLYYQNQQLKSALVTYKPQSTPTPSTTSDPTANWKTYTNTKYGFSIKHPAPDPNDSTEKFNTYTDDLIEVNGLDSLIFRVEPILTKNDPMTWWSTQKTDPYSQNPTTCFSKETAQVIKSLYEPDKNAVDFGRKVVVLDGLQSAESKIGNCPEPGTVRIILISLDGKLLRITYTWSSMSEQILSTFKFLGQDCSDSVINISITPPNSQWKCTIREGNTPEDKIIFLKREDGLQVAFPKITGVDSFPNNCPENITYVNLGDAHQSIKLCKNTTSLQSEILQQIIYNQTLSTSSNASDGLFYISMNTSLNLSASDKQELKSMFDSIRLLK